MRIDQFSSVDETHVIETIRKFSAIPTIATIRTMGEGGGWRGSDAERLELFRAVLPEVHAIDIELHSVSILPQVVAEARALNKIVIISNHNFEGTPSSGELATMAREAKDLGADLVKLSATSRTQEDLQVLAAFTVEHAALGLIVIAMGDHGHASRIFFPLLGSRLTYARSGLPPASGQLPYDETLNLLLKFSPEFRQKKIIELEMLDGA